MPVMWGREVTRAWVGFEVRGLEELQAATEKALQELGVGVREAMLVAAKVVEREARQKAPVDTGRLRASIEAEVRALGGGEVQGIVGSDVVYAPYQEFGTRYMEGRFYLTGAMEAKEEEVLRILEKFVDKVVTTIERY